MSRKHERGAHRIMRLIYTVDSSLAEQCLAELDIREKGGYARDVVDVIEDDTGD